MFYLGLWTDNNQNVDNTSTKPTDSLSNFTIDDKNVIPEESSIPVLNITEASSQSYSTKHSQWAEMIDVNKPVTDFHEKIPHMAHKYNFELDTFQKQVRISLEKVLETI